MSEVIKSDKNSEKKARETLLNSVMDHLIDSGYPCDRVTDYGTIATQVGDTVVIIKFVVPKLFDKDGNEKWSIDEGINGYEMRVANDKQKEVDRIARERLSKEKQAKRWAKAAEQAQQAQQLAELANK